MKILWCWACKKDVPMLDDQEWDILWRTFEAASGRGRDPRPIALAEYERLTGYKETSFNSLFLHRVSRHGPPCPRCGKVLRTPIAYKCFECGFKVHEPNWSYLFCLEADAISIKGGRILVDANEQDVVGKLTSATEIEFRDGTARVCRASVLSMEIIHEQSENRTVRMEIQTTVKPSEIKAGQTVWLTGRETER